MSGAVVPPMAQTATRTGCPRPRKAQQHLGALGRELQRRGAVDVAPQARPRVPLRAVQDLQDVVATWSSARVVTVDRLALSLPGDQGVRGHPRAPVLGHVGGL